MNENKASSQMKHWVEGKELVVEKEFTAPRNLVFKMFSDPVHLANWWGPKGWETTNSRFEFEPNGVWNYCMECVDKDQVDFYGQKSCGKSIFHEIVSPDKIVYTDVFADEDGTPTPGAPEMHITLTLEENQGKTKLLSRTQFASEEEVQKVIDMGVVQGLTSHYEELDSYLNQL
ncbi:SRPBCC domain-containing protein [Halalkalibacillus halophilus]|uniref:SRPBCC domain-containing protein n=1 Tax=Halalkalibacillus halophilus TaxID=392827 RepID=UPI000407A75D|nr:SRPBCC domain-containing protein [Halalkalibacillus halophilus]